MDWTTIGKWIASILGGGFLIKLIMWYPVRNAIKRQENSKADNAEIQMSTFTNAEYIKLIKQLREEKANLIKRFEEYDEKFTRQEQINQQLMAQLGIKNKELISLDDEVTKCKRAIKSYTLCSINENKCPILNKYKELK